MQPRPLKSSTKNHINSFRITKIEEFFIMWQSKQNLLNLINPRIFKVQYHERTLVKDNPASLEINEITLKNNRTFGLEKKRYAKKFWRNSVQVSWIERDRCVQQWILVLLTVWNCWDLSNFGTVRFHDRRNH